MILNPNGIYWYDNRARVRKRKRNVIGGNIIGLLTIYHEQEAPPLTHMNFSMVPGKESFSSNNEINMHAYKVTQKMKDPRHIVFMFSSTLSGMKNQFT